MDSSHKLYSVITERKVCYGSLRVFVTSLLLVLRRSHEATMAEVITLQRIHEQRSESVN